MIAHEFFRMGLITVALRRLKSLVLSLKHMAIKQEVNPLNQLHTFSTDGGKEIIGVTC